MGRQEMALWACLAFVCEGPFAQCVASAQSISRPLANVSEFSQLCACERPSSLDKSLCLQLLGACPAVVGEKALEAVVGEGMFNQLLEHREGNGGDVGAGQCRFDDVARMPHTGR